MSSSHKRWGRCPSCGLLVRTTPSGVRVEGHTGRDERECPGKGMLADEVVFGPKPDDHMRTSKSVVLATCPECAESRPMPNPNGSMPRHVVRGGVPCPGEGQRPRETTKLASAKAAKKSRPPAPVQRPARAADPIPGFLAMSPRDVRHRARAVHLHRMWDEDRFPQDHR